MRRAAAAALAALAALAMGSCGSEARDLFLVTRGGDVPGARLTLRVTDDGRASCNGKALVDITSAQLIAARETERDRATGVVSGAGDPRRGRAAVSA